MQAQILPFNYTKRHAVVEIGCRHTLEHRVMRDRASGEYQEMNPLIEGHMELWQTIIAPPSMKLISRSRKLSLVERLAHVVRSGVL